MENRPSRTEQRVKYGLVILAAVILVVVIALYLAPAFRLNLAQTLHIVPGADAEKVASSDEARLIVISEPVKTELAGTRYRQEARYILYYGPPMRLTDLQTGREISLPISERPRLFISEDRTKLLFKTDQGSAIFPIGGDQATSAPAEPEGNWNDDVYIAKTACPGASPHDEYTFCIARGGASKTVYLFGNWQVSVKRYATTEGGDDIFRGRGFIPIVGFAPDDKSIYIYSQYDIWKAPITLK